MILLDTALSHRERDRTPIKIGLFGAGAIGKGIVFQVLRQTPGITVAGVCNRHIERAEEACRHAGVEPVRVATARELEDAMARGIPAVTDSQSVLNDAEGVDVVIEATGAIEYGANVILEAIACGKRIISINAELDATLGPILKKHADRAGVLLSGCDGDQPGVIMNLHRFVKGIGLKPLLCGNIKGLQDCYRTPETQAEFARMWNQNPCMVTSFADGTKISFEQTCVANATGMQVARRGMTGRHFDGHINELTRFYDAAELETLGGIVDYVVGAKPAPGVFVFATSDEPYVREHMRLYKLGDGPLYSFYTPYHLCWFEIQNSIARVVDFNDTVFAPIGPPRVEVIATAKRDLREDDFLDGIGGFDLYGVCENTGTARDENLLPMGLAEGCRLRRSMLKDDALTFDDVDLPEGRTIDRLWREQCEAFGPLAAGV